MDAEIPAVSSLACRLGALSTSRLRDLACVSGVPFTTLWKIRTGITTNPGIETVRKFVQHLAEIEADPELAAREAA